MNTYLKKPIFQAFRRILVFLDKNPTLRRQVYFFICKYGAYNYLKKFYAGRLQEKSVGQFSPLMVGPVVVLDISEAQLSTHAGDIYLRMKQLKAVNSQKSIL